MDAYSSETNSQFPPPPQPIRTNGKAIASMVLGILSIIIPYIGIILGVIAVILSLISRKEIQRSGEQGQGFAIVGLVCGIVGTVLYIAAIVCMFVFIHFIVPRNEFLPF